MSTNKPQTKYIHAIIASTSMANESAIFQSNGNSNTTSAIIAIAINKFFIQDELSHISTGKESV